MNCKVRQGVFNRWYIFSAIDPFLAWGGSGWIFCAKDGRPLGVQLCNFETEDEAREYCREVGLVPARSQT